MKIVVIYKWAPDPQNATVTENGVIDWGNKRTISEYDPVAIRSARILADSIGTDAQVIGLTAGETGAASPKAIQAAASRGLDSLTVIADEQLQDATADVYAQVLAAGIKQIGDADLIIAGDASADIGGQAVPGLLAGHLNLPSFSDVSTIKATTDGIQIQRQGAHTEQTLLLKSPAVIAVTTDAAPIPLVGMKDMMAARKKPVTKLTLSDLALSENVSAAKTALEIITQQKPETKQRKHIIFDSDQVAQELVAALREEGVLS